jgi:hypothetical protein
VYPVQAALRHPPSDAISVNPDPRELPSRDDAMLLRRQEPHRNIRVCVRLLALCTPIRTHTPSIGHFVLPVGDERD